MSITRIGEKVSVTSFCGSEKLCENEKTRQCFDVFVNKSSGDSKITLTYSEAQEAIILLSAAIAGWKGQI